MTGLILTGVKKETSFFWEFKECKGDKAIIFTQFSPQGEIE